jgi:hypothetical protein
MGGAVGVASSQASESSPLIAPLKNLPNAIEDCLYVQEKFPLVVDPSDQAARFLKYQLGTFIRADDPVNFTPQHLNRALAGALRYGRTMTIYFESLVTASDAMFLPVSLT